VTHNYVDIMSRIYVDSTPVRQGSKKVGGAQSGGEDAPPQSERGPEAVFAAAGER
jgi:hypothetical protein